ncbi:Uncharacterised protein [Serratia entomophila]|uniref:hypothetical protein n=1 Tax=Serratia TaxID=613 RepID=UPI0021787E36|nr:hypothetical protein [Serratia entomophila]CAI0848973.1 Uncharacterised protein [Serratia entomophila]CAI1544774.1 Uncharacterised protein [Serratia entomophila]CAI1562164.1 Uncharacterised protein [Serratia entomophila]CAI1597996.1 Uncharacterised protein [Serratia entomophila]CAI1675184.1 Uncharacterised protein [Serratia entomophila]
MEITTINQLIAAGSGLLGAIIGAAVSGLVNYRIEHSKRDYEKKSYAAGFLSEIEALQMIIRERGYLESFSSFLELPEIQRGESVGMYYVLIPDDYARFYNANMSKVGVLGPEKTKKIIQYHQLLQAIIQDFKPESYVSKHGFTKGTIEENIHLLTSALSLGDEILNG